MNPFSAGLAREVRASLSSLGDSSPIQDTRTMSGGCINHATRLRTASNVYLLKYNQDALPGMFQSEAEGLRLIRATQTVRVPQVFAVLDPPPADSPAFILLEWIESPHGADSLGDLALLGEQLAAMHQTCFHTGKQIAYGLEKANYLGSSVQPNHWEADWIKFFREERLLHQVNMAEKNGHLPPERRSRLVALVANLEHWLFGVERQPCLVHGDLWSGNVLPGAGNQPVLIDPAVYYADREVEIAYTELFGGFERRFYQAYQAAWPLPPGYPERRELYNLYHLLNHLNIFGESYGSHVDAVLRRYTTG